MEDIHDYTDTFFDEKYYKVWGVIILSGLVSTYTFNAGDFILTDILEVLEGDDYTKMAIYYIGLLLVSTIPSFFNTGYLLNIIDKSSSKERFEKIPERPLSRIFKQGFFLQILIWCLIIPFLVVVLGGLYFLLVVQIGADFSEPEALLKLGASLVLYLLLALAFAILYTAYSMAVIATYSRKRKFLSSFFSKEVRYLLKSREFYKYYSIAVLIYIGTGLLSTIPVIYQVISIISTAFIFGVIGLSLPEK